MSLADQKTTQKITRDIVDYMTNVDNDSFARILDDFLLGVAPCEELVISLQPSSAKLLMNVFRICIFDKQNRFVKEGPSKKSDVWRASTARFLDEMTLSEFMEIFQTLALENRKLFPEKFQNCKITFEIVY